MINLRNKIFQSNVFMTITIIWLNYVRCPDLLIAPRFWAEEGAVYFPYAYSHSWFENLITPHFGYHTLYNSLATSFASIFSLESAPAVTTYLACAVQIFASLYVIWADLPVLDTRLKKYLAAVTLPLLSNDRIWLSTIGVQYWLCVITFLILLSNAEHKRIGVEIIEALVLIITGLTGVLSCFMTPVFVFKAFKCKSKKFAIYSAILSLCSVLQIVIFVHAFLRHDPEIVQRLVHNEAVHLILKCIVFQFAYPLFSVLPFQNPLVLDFCDKLFAIFNRLLGWKPNGIFQMPAVLAGIYVILFLIRITVKKMNDIDSQTIILSFILVFPLSTVLSLNMSSGARYIFAPSIMILVFLISSCDDKRLDRFFKLTAKMFVIVALVTHGLQYPMSLNFEGLKAFSSTWPRWRDEVAVWRTDKNHQLNIWPPPWRMTLENKKGGN